MAHSCIGEYCIATMSWDCPNRIDRKEADKRTPEEIAEARKYAQFAMGAAGRAAIESQEYRDLLAYIKGAKKEVRG